MVCERVMCTRLDETRLVTAGGSEPAGECRILWTTQLRSDSRAAYKHMCSVLTTHDAWEGG